MQPARQNPIFELSMPGRALLPPDKSNAMDNVIV